MSKCNHDNYLSIYKYLENTPEKFYSKEAYSTYNSFLEQCSKTSLIELLNENQNEINKSLHLLEEINRNLVGFGRDHILTAWWLAVIPAITIFLTTLSMSILGDWTRDKLDPTLK